MAAKGLISQQQLLNNNHHQAKPIKTNQITNGKADYAGKHPVKHSIHQATTQALYNQHGSANRSKRNTLTSDGRSAEDEYNQSDGYSPTIRSEPDGQPSLNKSLAESKSSSGNSSGSSPPPQAPNPVVVEMYENLAAELKAKLGNPSIGPILLPPKDYDTVCRSQGRLVELDKRACTNSLVVGVNKAKKAKETEKPVKKLDNLILNTNEKVSPVKEGVSASPKEAVSKDAPKEAPKVPAKEAPKNDVKTKEITIKKIDPAAEPKASTEKSLEANKIKKLTPEELKEQKKRLDHEQIREQQRQYEQKLKNLQRKQELYEQQQLLIEQQKQVRRELSQQHKLNSKAAVSKEPIKSGKSEERLLSSSAKQTNASAETSAVIHSGGIKQIGSSLASKIKQSLIGSNKEKLQPQLICHKTIHDSLQSLNKLSKSDLLLSNDKLKSKNSLKPIDNPNKTANEARLPAKERSANAGNAKTSTLNTSMSNSSSNLSRDLNEKLNTMNSRSDSSNVSKSISSGIGSAGNLNTKKSRAASNFDDPPYLSTDEELEDELLIHDLSECVDEYMPDFAFNQYLNDEDDEIIDDLDDEECGNRVVRRMAIREKLLLLEKSANPEKSKSEFGSTGERQMTSSEDDAEINSICYDENLVITKINTAKRIKKPSSKSIKLDQLNQRIVDNVKNAKNITKHSGAKAETKTADVAGHPTKQPPAKAAAQPSSANPVKRSETYYEMNSGQKKMFQYNNYYFPHTNKSPIDRSAMHQPKLFYFPNPEFKAAQQQLMGSPGQPQPPPQLMKYHLGRPQQQAPIRRQKSTPNVNAKFSYHPMLINGHMNSSVEMMSGDDHLMNRKIVNLEKYPVGPMNLAAHQRPVSMVNMMQPEHFRMPPHPADFKRVPIYY